MAEPASLTLPRDLIEPIINAHIQAALAEALGSKSDLLAKMAGQILNAPVTAGGNPCNSSSYEKAGTFIEVSLRLAMQKAFRELMEAELEKHKETLKAHLTAELKKANSPLTRALVEGMCKGVVTNGLRYNLTVTSPL